MKKYNLLLALISVLFLLNSSNALASFKCPVNTGHPMRTANNDGDSSYYSEDVTKFYSQLMAKGFSKSDPVLDVMAGYGAELNSLLKLGALNIYVNELNQDNIKCMRQFNFKLANRPNVTVKYISGDIINEKMLDQLPNNYFKIVFVFNGIQFFSFMDFQSFSKAMYKKMAKKSIIALAYENPHLEKQNKMIKGIFDQWKAGAQTAKRLDDLVNNAYDSHSFPSEADRHCSYQAYQSAKSNKDKVYSLGACQLETLNYKGYTTAYNPRTVRAIMHDAGFYLIGQRVENNGYGTIVQIFEKVS